VAIVAGNSPEDMKVIAQRIREIGLDRILYATDGPLTDGTPRDGWALTRAKLPLTDRVTLSPAITPASVMTGIPMDPNTTGAVSASYVTPGTGC